MAMMSETLRSALSVAMAVLFKAPSDLSRNGSESPTPSRQNSFSISPLLQQRVAQGLLRSEYRLPRAYSHSTQQENLRKR
jgi:hypothetical protein